MKKILFFAAAFAAILISCNNEMGEGLSQESESETNNNVKIYATIIQDEEPNTTSSRVMMGQSNGSRTPLRWHKGDEIRVFNALDNNNYKIYSKFKTSSSTDDGDAKAVFEQVVNNGNYYQNQGHFAIYPYQDNSNYEYIKEVVFFGFPATQIYTENSFDPKAMPLIGTEVSTANFEFKAKAAVLRLKVSTKDEGCTVSSIRIDGPSLSGWAELFKNNYTLKTPYGVLSNSYVTLSCPTPVAIGETPKDFNIVLPSGRYDEGSLTITINTNKGNTVRTSTRFIALEDGKVYNIGITVNPTISGTTPRNGGTEEWVQLWDGGPKFSKTNDIGGDLGTFYSWSESDIATSVWGNNWRMATSEEFEGLLNPDNCTAQWEYLLVNGGRQSVYGVRFTGRGAFKDNSITLYAGGYKFNGQWDSQAPYNSEVFYWSSTPSKNNSNMAHYLRYSKDGYKEVRSISKSAQLLIRPVLKE